MRNYFLPQLRGMFFLKRALLLLTLITGNGYAQVPAPPTGLAPAGSGSVPAGATSVVLRWSADPFATSYNVRANDNTNGSAVQPGNTCPLGHPHYFCMNSILTNSVSMQVVPGHSYTWFMQACNSAGCGTTTVVSFDVPVSSVNAFPAAPENLSIACNVDGT